jgi:hypothetical protein
MEGRQGVFRRVGRLAAMSDDLDRRTSLADGWHQECNQEQAACEAHNSIHVREK